MLSETNHDVDGIRIAKEIVDDSEIEFLVDKNRDYAQVLIETIDAAQSVTYVHGDDLLTMVRPDSGTVSYHYDGQMSTRQLSDADGGISDSIVYDAYGKMIAVAGSTSNYYLYTGQQLDPQIGFYYLRARYYSSNIGRFLSLDSYPGSKQDPQSLHKYTYGHSNPVMNQDPSGQAVLIGFLILLQIIFILLCLIVGLLVRDFPAVAYPWSANETDFNNHMRHCWASCIIGVLAGLGCSLALGEAWEWWGSDEERDRKANHEGLGCAGSARGVSSILDLRALINGCHDCCVRRAPGAT